MKKNEVLRELARYGYRFERQGRKHVFYTNGVRRVTISAGLKLGPEAVQQLKLLFKREEQLRAKQG